MSSIVDVYEYGAKIFIRTTVVVALVCVCLMPGAFMLGRMVEEDNCSERLKSVGIKEIAHNHSCVNGVNTNWYEIIWIEDVKKEGNN